MTIEHQLDAYRRGELTLAEVVDALPVVSDGSPDLTDFLDALEAGAVPIEVVVAWSHPSTGLAVRGYRTWRGDSDVGRAWKFLPKVIVDDPRPRRAAVRRR